VQTRNPSQFALEALERRILLSVDPLTGTLAGSPDAPGSTQSAHLETMEIVLVGGEFTGLQEAAGEGKASDGSISCPDDFFAGLATDLLPDADPSAQTSSCTLSHDRVGDPGESLGQSLGQTVGSGEVEEGANPGSDAGQGGTCGAETLSCRTETMGAIDEESPGAQNDGSNETTARTVVRLAAFEPTPDESSELAAASGAIAGPTIFMTSQLTETLRAGNGPPAEELVRQLLPTLVPPESFMVTADSALTIHTSGSINLWDFNPAALPRAGILRLVIQGADTTDDTLMVDISNGDVPIPVTFHGGDGGYDTLVLTGATDTTYIPGEIFGDGTLRSGQTTIMFTGLEPVFIDGAKVTGISPPGLSTTATTLTFVTPGSLDVITIDSPVEGQNRIFGSSDGVAFESITFTNIQTVVIDTGANDVVGKDADEITIANNLVATGLKNLTILTGAGSDVLRVQTANLSLPVAGGVWLFDGGAGADTLIGPNAPSKWALTSANAGTLKGLTFQNTENIIGGDGGDEFEMKVGGSLSGKLDGGKGTNTLDYSAYMTGITVNLKDKTATGAGSINNIQNVMGGSGNDLLVAGLGDNTLSGGSGSDTYKFFNDWSRDTVIDSGASGTDILDFSAVTAHLVITVHADGTVSVTDFTNQVDAAGIENVIAGTGNNRIVYENGASFAGEIDAGPGGINTIDFTGYNTPVLIDLANGTVTVGGFINGSTMAGLIADMHVRYLNDGAGLNQATVSLETALSFLNGGLGIQRASTSFSIIGATPLANLNNRRGVGSRGFLSAATPLANWPNMRLQAGPELGIRLTNQQMVYVDLGTPNTLGDILSAIMTADSRLNASINAAGTGIDIRDSAGGTGNIAVADLGASTTARELGLIGVGTGNLLSGKSITGDIRFILTDWSTVSVDIGNATTVQDVLNAINNADPRLTAVINDARDGIKITDSAGGDQSLAFENLNGSTTATDLGLTVPSVGNVLNGRPLVSDLRITTSDGTVIHVNLRGADTVGKVIDAINAADSRLYAALNEASDGINIEDSLAGSSNVAVANLSGSTAATDLGLAKTGTGNLLRGNSLVNDLAITLRDATVVQVNLGNPATVGDILTAIHAADPRLTALINAAGTGITITDSTGGSGNLTVANLNGCTAATDLGILGAGTGGTLAGTPIVRPVVSTTISNVQHAIGGSGDDLLKGSGANNTLTGGEGSDTYMFSGSWGTDTIEDYGVQGTDVLDFSGVPAALTITIKADGKVSITDGGSANKVIDAETIEKIIGGSGDDTFVFENGAIFRGTFDGGAGRNKLDFSAYTTAIKVDLVAAIATASYTTTQISRFCDITGGAGDDILAGNAEVNRLEGGPGNDVFRGGGGDDTLVGGTGDDTYFIVSGLLTIIEAAGEGFDTLAYNNYVGGAVTVNLKNGIAPGTRGVSNIESVLGGPGADNFTGTDLNDSFYFVNDWGVDVVTDESATDSDTMDFSAVTRPMVFNFTNGTVVVTQGTNIATGTMIEKVVGGSSDDIFIFDDDWGNYTIISGGTIDEDILDFSAVSADLTFTFDKDGKVSVRDKFGNTLGASAGIENIIGGSGKNTFIFEDQGGLEGYIGGAGTNILDYSAYTTAIFLDLSTMDVVYTGKVIGKDFTSYGVAHATGLKGANNVTRVIGGSSKGDTLIGPGKHSVWIIDGANSGTLNTSFTFSGIENLTGSADYDDSFTVTEEGSLSGTLSGNPYGLISSATRLLVPMNPDGIAAGIDTLTFSGGSYSNVTFTATSADTGVIARDKLVDGVLASDKFRFAGLESVVDNSTAANRTFTYAADTTAVVSLGGVVTKDQTWTIQVDGTPYSYTAVTGDNLEEVATRLSARIAAGGYLTTVLANSILVTKLTGGAPAVVPGFPVLNSSPLLLGSATVEAPITKDVTLRISKDNALNLHITAESGEFAPFTFSQPSGTVYVNTGMGNDTITVEQFSTDAGLVIDGKGGTADKVIYEVQTGDETQSIQFGSGSLTNNGLPVFTSSNVESARNLVIKGTAASDAVILESTGSDRYQVRSENETFQAVTFDRPESLSIDAGLGNDTITVSLDSFTPALILDGGDGVDNLYLGNGRYTSLTLGMGSIGEGNAGNDAVDGSFTVDNFTFNARPSIANRVHIYRTEAGKITIVDETSIGTKTVTISDPSVSLTINTGYNAPATTEYIHVGQKPDGSLNDGNGFSYALGNLNADLIINAGNLSKNLDGEDSVTILATSPSRAQARHHLQITSPSTTLSRYRPVLRRRW
jgi:hypothetical protein